MRTVLISSATAGALGEEAVARRFAEAFIRSGETYRFFGDVSARPSEEPSPTTVSWHFVFGEHRLPVDSPMESLAVVLLVVPSISGLKWAQQQKNHWTLRGLMIDQISAIVLFNEEHGAIPSSLVHSTLGVESVESPIRLSHLFLADNDNVPPIRNDEPWRKTVGAVRLRLDNAWASDSKSAGVSWSAIEREALTMVWETWATDVPVQERVRQCMAMVIERNAVAAPEASLLTELESRLLDHVTGLGPLEPFLRDPDVNEIMINGVEKMFVERLGKIQSVDSPFDHETHVKMLIERIVAPSGRRVDWAAPFCDVRLKDGSRVNIVLPPLALDGPVVTIRRFRPGFTSMESLERCGTVDAPLARKLEQMVRDRCNIVIAGNTGAGKTTLMNVLASVIPDNERILTLEDAAELSIDKPHVVRLETRIANTEGRGQITMRDLVINALRMRPDRLLVGECRGDEVIPMLQAMNTGHDGSMTTVHANSADEVSSRLESLVSMAAPGWPVDLIRQQIRSAIDVIVFMRRDGSSRRVMEVSHVV